MEDYKIIEVAPAGPHKHKMYEYEGIEILQHPDVISQFKKIVKDFDRIIEIGTYTGSLSLLIHRLKKSETELISYDINPVINKVPKDLGIDFRIADCFSNETIEEIKKLIEEPKKRVLLLCDGGNKNLEVNTFCKFLKYDDVIMTHDYAESCEEYAEITHKIGWYDLEESWIWGISEELNKNNIIRHPLYNEFKQVMWGIFINNKIKIATYVMTFDQGQWIMRNLENAYPHVDQIYVMHSNLPWGYNPNARSIYTNTFDINIVKESKFMDKITIIEGDWMSDTEQRNACLQRAKADGYDYLMVQDADEYFFHRDFEKIIQCVKDNPQVDVFAINLYAFWKSFKYVIVSNDKGRIGGTNQTIVNLRTVDKYDYIRDVHGGVHMTIPDVICYHGSYVLTDDQVYKKIKTWSHNKDFDTDKWYNEVWLPWTLESKNLHPIWPWAWTHCEVFEEELPEVIADLKINKEAITPSTSEIINILFDKFGFTSYLEIGVGNPNNTFKIIKAALKHGIDPSGEGTHKMTSDEFFMNHAGKQKYDVIFIDGFHSAHQAYRDAINSINHLNEGGFILMHDCNPPTKEHAVEFKDYKGGAWNGTVYKAFIQLKYDYKDWSVFTIDNDWGYGILTPLKILENKIMPYDTNNSSWDGFDKNRKELLQLVSYKEYVNVINIVPMRSKSNEKVGLRELCKEFPENAVMAEIGSYAGESTKIFLESGKIKQLYAIDPWASGYDNSDIASDSNFTLVEQLFDKNVKGHNVVKMKTTLAGAFNSLPVLDVIYIDGNHQYEAVKEDIELALQKIKKGGIICGHDYHDYAMDTVIKAVNEKLGTPYKVFEDSSWMVKI